MDQIRKALAWLKAYHFWVLSVLVAIVALACWKMAAAKLSREFAANQSAITSEFKSQKDFREKPFHANDVINENQLKQIELQAQNVEAIWKTLYERQSKRVLTWPEALSPAFRDYVTKRKFGDDIPRNLRDNYQNYIDRHFESLPKKISARVLAEGETGGMGGEGFMRGGGRGMFRGEGGGGYNMSGEGGMGAGALAGQDDDYLCEWVDQGLVRRELDFPTTPSAMKIWVTQENLWVYHTLLDIISSTNEAANADRMSNAAVRTIYSLEVGRPAAIASLARGRVEILQGPAAGVPLEGDMTGEGGAAVGTMEGGAPQMSPDMFGDRSAYSESGLGGSGVSAEQEKAMLLAARYVDATGKPLGGAAAVPMEGAADPSMAAPTAELPTGPFKRLPIRMTLKVDQRWLTHLISACASQPLPVEVTEVRINVPDASGLGGGEGGYRGGGMDGSGGGSGSSYHPPLSNNVELLTFQQNPHVVTVVIQGIVTIFNEPDPSVLKANSGEQVAAAQ